MFLKLCDLKIFFDINSLIVSRHVAPSVILINSREKLPNAVIENKKGKSCFLKFSIIKFQVTSVRILNKTKNRDLVDDL